MKNQQREFTYNYIFACAHARTHKMRTHARVCLREVAFSLFFPY